MGSERNKECICIICDTRFISWNKNANTCSITCDTENRYRKYIKKWLNGEITGMRGSCGLSTRVRRYILEKASYKCEKCGFNTCHPRTMKTILEIHHIDENPENNRPENFMVLCPNCHALEDSRDSTKGNGRRYYREQYHKNKGVT